MTRKEEISVDIQLWVCNLHKPWKRHKAIWKCLGIHQSTIRQTVWGQFSTMSILQRSVWLKGHKTKTVNEVKRSPWVAATGVKTSVTLVTISDHEPAICQSFNSQSVHGRALQRTVLSSRQERSVKKSSNHPNSTQHDSGIYIWSNIWTQSLIVQEESSTSCCKNLPTSKHQHIDEVWGRYIMIWASFATPGPGPIMVMQG